MESALGWLGQIFGAILKFFPRIIVIRATHGGVKWKYGKYIRAMGPGVHVYLPLITEIMNIAKPIQRQLLLNINI